MDLHAYLMSSLKSVVNTKSTTFDENFKTILTSEKLDSITPSQIATLAGLCEKDYREIFYLSIACIGDDPEGPHDARAAFIMSFVDVNFIFDNMITILGCFISTRAARLYRFIEDISLWSNTKAKLDDGKITLKSCYSKEEQKHTFEALRTKILYEIPKFKYHISPEQMRDFAGTFR